MNDRLAELGSPSNWANDSDDDLPPPEKAGGGDIEMGDTNKSSSQQAKHMEHFFREVETIKADIERVTKATRSIGEINEAALQATTTEQENELSARLKPLINDTNQKAKRTKTLLGLLKEETQILKDEGTAKGSDLR
jgi:predicted transcriptional regulator